MISFVGEDEGVLRFVGAAVCGGRTRRMSRPPPLSRPTTLGARPPAESRDFGYRNIGAE
jgi:hypothetical protein